MEVKKHWRAMVHNSQNSGPKDTQDEAIKWAQDFISKAPGQTVMIYEAVAVVSAIQPSVAVTPVR